MGAAIAIDNCVSTQPEVESPEWLIERMVRDMSMPTQGVLMDDRLTRIFCFAAVKACDAVYGCSSRWNFHDNERCSPGLS